VMSTFEPTPWPFPRWWGPFSPARGTRSGLRVRQGWLYAWVQDSEGREFWPALDSPGVRGLIRLVLDRWRGGRILILPDGSVIKPLQDEEEAGIRRLIGLFDGPIVFERPDGGTFDMSDPGDLEPGDPWPGPATTGLECQIRPDGSLTCTWYHPAPWGRDEVRERLTGPDPALARGFRRCRPGETAGRVRVTENGHLITNVQDGQGRWIPCYVGWISPEAWPFRSEWIGEEDR
jgi:hypothetical protein